MAGSMLKVAPFALVGVALLLVGAALLLAARPPALGQTPTQTPTATPTATPTPTPAPTPTAYTLTTAASPTDGGTVWQRRDGDILNKPAASGSHDTGTVVHVTATAARGFRFQGWSGACTGTDPNSCTVTMTADRTVTATFVRTHWILTMIAEPTEGGTVSDGGLYGVADNTVVTVTATPNSGYRFDSWSGDGCTGSGACTVTMDQNREITATFVSTVTRYTLTTSASPSGGGTLTGAGTYDSGTAVTVTATPNLGYRFVEWGGACLGSGTCSVTMTADRSVTATFATTPTHRLIARAQPAAGGTVSGGGTYNSGTVVTVTATPNSGYRFDRWSGACTGSGACSVTMTTTRIVLAVFSTTATLTTNASPSAGGTVGGAGTYNVGTRVLVAAYPKAGYAFERWSGDCTGSGACRVVMSVNRSVTAHFTSGSYNVRVRAQPLDGGTVTGGGAYSPGTRVTVTAEPEPGYLFEGWSGGGCGTSSPCSFTVNGHRILIARFALPAPPESAPLASAPIVEDVDDGDEPPGAGMSVTSGVRGDAPDDPSFRFRHTCMEPGGFALAPDETRRFPIEADAACTLTVTDGGGAAGVSGRIKSFPFTTAAADVCVFSLDGDTGDLFTDRAFADGQYVAEVDFAWDVTVDIPLARGFARIAWPGDEAPVGEALGPLASVVTAVYSWDADARRWLSWFPGGDALDANTLTAFQPGGTYILSAASAPEEWRVDVGDDWGAPSVVHLGPGFTSIAWPGDDVSIDEALGPLASAVAAVYFWDAAGQRWLSWFPGGDALGVNTLSSFQAGGAYLISTASARDWRVGDDARAPSVIRLASGLTSIAWPGDDVSIDEALGPLASSVSAVYSWDADAQRWLSWFPGGDALGVNTLTAFQPGGAYVVSTASALDWRVGNGEELPAC